MAEVLLYSDIDDYAVKDFFAACNAITDPAEELTLRICSNGGEPSIMTGFLSKLKDMPNAKKGKVDGKAYSCGLYTLCYLDYVECIDSAQGLVHRAAYSEWFEQSSYFDDGIKLNLERTNKFLRAALEAKIDVPAFEAIAKCTMDEIFSMDGRREIYLTAQQMKKIGLVDKIIQLTPKRKAEIETAMANIASNRSGFKMAAIHTQTENKPDMEFKEIKTLEELKAAFPSIYAQAIQLGVEKEYSRVMALQAFRKVDPKAVAKAIKKRKEATTEFQAEMNAKANSPEALALLEKENAKAINTDIIDTGKEKPETAEAKAKREGIEAFEKRAKEMRAAREGKVIA
jgi:ATP-dependent protease ClpP protease subunit